MLRMPRPALAAAVAASVTGVTLLSFGEWQSWRVSRAEYPKHARRGPEGGRDVVLVLGFRSSDHGRINAVQRWRTRIAVRSAAPGSLFVFSGAAVRGARSEAEVMADYGRGLGIPSRDIALETHARSTRENVALAIPWLREARTIRIASNTAHARRARRYLHELDPALWERVVPTRDHLLLELGPLRLALTFYDWVAGRAAAKAEGSAGPAGAIGRVEERRDADPALQRDA